MKNWTSSFWLQAGLFAFLGFVAFGTTLTNDFVNWDDPYLIQSNPVIRSISPQTIGQAFTSFDPELYAPLTILSYQLDVFIGGVRPWIFHFTSLLLHIISALLVTRIATRLIDDEHWGMICGLLFLVHPLTVETVAWASARKDVLSAMLGLLAIERWMAFTAHERMRDGVTSFMAFTLGLLGKVSIAPLALAFPVLTKKHRTRSMAYMIPAIALGCVALFGKRAVESPLSLIQTALLFCKSFATSLLHMMMPIDLSPIYESPIPSISDVGVLVGIALLIAMMVSIALLYKRSPLTSALLAAIVALSLPVIVTFPKNGYLALTSDRYSYLPLAAAILLICFWMKNMFDLRSRSVTGSIGVIIVLLGFSSYRQTTLWSDSITLFEHAAALAPTNVQARNNLGVALMNAKNADRALQEFRRIIDSTPYAKAWINIAILQQQRGETADALSSLQQAILADPKDPEPHFAHGSLLSDLQRTDEAMRAFRLAIDIDPHHTPSMNNLAALLLQSGDIEQAISLLEQTLTINPYYGDAWFNYGLALNAEKRTIDAGDAFLKALIARPAEADFVQVAAQTLLLEGRIPETILVLKNALNAKPNDPEIAAIALENAKKILAIEQDNAAAINLIERMLDEGTLSTR